MDNSKKNKEPERRCINCNKLLATGNFAAGEIKIKCDCGTINIIGAQPASYQERLNLSRK